MMESTVELTEQSEQYVAARDDALWAAGEELTAS
jgi:hypothetical protein